MSELTKRQRLDLMWKQLDTERASFLPHWRDLGDHILPRRPRFTLSDTNRGERRNLKIIDSTATLAIRTLKSGMMGGVTSPARPWFKLTTPDPAIAELGHVKLWLEKVEENISGVFLRSNLYQCLPGVYGDLGAFASAAMMIEEDFSNVVRFRVFPIGSYVAGLDDTGKINVFMREFRMTIRQLVETFGERNGDDYNWSNFSDSVKQKWKENQREQWIDVVHSIYPNDEYDADKANAKYKKFASCYYEKSSDDKNKFLRESGYDRFPVFFPRWEVTGEDTYGTDCPGMTALGDIKQLQIGEKRIAQAIEKMVNPPMKGPSHLMSRKISILPGDYTADDSREGQGGLKPIHEVQPRVAELSQQQEIIRQRVRRAFFEDLFLLFADDERANVTATEISVRKEEKLLVLGSVLEQLNQDLLDPLIDATFAIMVAQSMQADGTFAENGLIPPPPEEVQGVRLKVEYVSIMAAAQKALGLASMERFIGNMTQIAAVDPSVMQKVNLDEYADQYAERAGVSPKIVRTDEEVAAMRKAVAQQQAAAQKAQLIEQGANAAQKLSSADMSGDNALTRLVDNANAGNVLPA